MIRLDQTRCANCERPFPAVDDLCPHCGAMKPVRLMLVVTISLAIWAAIGAAIWWACG